MIKFKNAVLRVLLVLVISVTTMSVYAGGIFKVNSAENGDKAVVRIANFEAKNITLSIVDEFQNEVFYQESVDGDSDFAKVFDLSLLNNGNYVVIVNTGDEILTKTIEIINSKLTVKDSKKLKEPFFRVKEDTLLIFFYNYNNVDTQISFYDETENFFTDEFIGSGTKNIKQYSLSGLPSGKYLVTVSGENSFFNYSFDLEK
jgi:hypothetical protein